MMEGGMSTSDYDDHDDFDDDGGEDRYQARTDQTAERLDSLTKVLSQVVEAQSRQQREAQEAADRAKRSETERQIESRGQALGAAVRDADTAVQRAEAALREALDSGDPATTAARQRELSAAVARQINANDDVREWQAARAEYERRRAAAAANPPAEKAKAGGEAAADTTNLDRWTKANEAWYGVDADMTRAARTIATKIEEAGVIPKGSQAYFSRISSEMRRQFPDYFGQTPDAGGPSRSGGGGSAPRQGRVPAEIVAGWKRMGINTNDPKTMERMLGHAENLRAKGILSPTPSYGRILT